MIITNIIRGRLRDRLARQYHLRHKKEMEKNIALIERNQGKKLTPNIKRQCDEYAIESLGNRLFAPQLYVFMLNQDRFKEGFIPDNYYKSVVIPQVSGIYGTVANMRLFENVIFPKEYIPTIGSFSQGYFLGLGNRPLSQEELGKQMFANNSKVIFKLDTSHTGLGIFTFEKKSFMEQNFSRLGTGVFQYFIKQHDFYAQFNPYSVATFRITTTVEMNGEILPRATFLRLSAGSDAFIDAANCIRIPIDKKTGRFGDIGYTEDWSIVSQHPDSKIPFKGMEIPLFQESIELTKQLHSQISFIKCIGWDLTLDSNEEIKVMEWNAKGNGVGYQEYLTGPNFKGLDWERLALKKLVYPYQNLVGIQRKL